MESLVWANIQHRPTRSLVTALGVALGTVLILLTVGLARGFILERNKREANIGAEIIVRSAGTFGTGLTGNQPSLPVVRTEELNRIPGVKQTTPLIQYVYASENGFGFRAVEAVEFEKYSEITGVRILSGQIAQSDSEINIDVVLARERKVVPGNEIEVMGRMMKIAGIYTPECGARIKMRLPVLQERLAATGLCSMILVKCSTPADQDAVALRIQQASTARVQRIPSEVEDQIILTRDLPNLLSKIPALEVFLRVVVGIAIGISTLVILLAMYTTITERTREIGILKSLGATNGFILRTIEQEALLISFSGALIGFLFALLARYFITHVTSLRNIEFEPGWILTAFLVALIGGSLGGLYPALRAAHLDPVNALDYE